MKIKKKQEILYVPYKEYIFGMFKRPTGWRDLGKSGLFSKGEYRPYSYTIDRDHFSGQEEIRYNKTCRDCQNILNVGQRLADNKTFYFCHRCKRMYAN